MVEVKVMASMGMQIRRKLCVLPDGACWFLENAFTLAVADNVVRLASDSLSKPY